MNVFYRIDQKFRDHLKELKFEKRESGKSSTEYYTHPSGKQVKINEEDSCITFLDISGNAVSKSDSYTTNEINSFLNKD